MADRLIVAYALIALLALSAAGLVAWLRYHSRERTVDRQRRRERETYARHMAARDQSEV